MTRVYSFLDPRLMHLVVYGVAFSAGDLPTEVVIPRPELPEPVALNLPRAEPGPLNRHQRRAAAARARRR